MNRYITIGLLGLNTMAIAFPQGNYTNKHGDILTLNDRGVVTLEQAKQVGGPGGLSNKGVVPYPTSCRYKMWGRIASEGNTSIVFKVNFTHLIKSFEEAEPGACALFVAEANGKAMADELQYSLEKTEFTE